MKILQHIGTSWLQLERAHMTMKMYGSRLRTRRFYSFTFGTVVDLNNLGELKK